MSLKNKLYKKLKEEYLSYQNYLIDECNSFEVFESSYKTIIIEELTYMFHPSNNYDDYLVEKLIEMDNALEYLYGSWMQSSRQLNEVLDSMLRKKQYKKIRK